MVIYDILVAASKGRLTVPDDWDYIVNCHVALVVTCIRRIVGNDHDAEDVAQDVFLEAHRISQTKEIRNWPGFLRQLASRRAIDLLRKRSNGKRMPPSMPETEPISTFPEPYQTVIASELIERLRNSLCVLPEGQGQVFSMRYFEDMSNEEIAESLGISSNAVGLALHKARMRLQSLIDDKDKSGDKP